MIRTIVSLKKDDKVWLDTKAAEQKVSRAELIRRAIRLYRKTGETDTRSFHKLLSRTSGITNGQDGLELQNRWRDEWST